MKAELEDILATNIEYRGLSEGTLRPLLGEESSQFLPQPKYLNNKNISQVDVYSPSV